MKVLPPPGPQRTLQLTLLVVVLAGVAVVGWRYFGPASRPPTAAPPPAASNTQAKAAQTARAPAAPALPQPVRLGQLEPVPVAPESARNPFRFWVPPPPPVAPRPIVTPPPPPPPQVPIGPPPPPPISLNFIGRIVRNDGKVIATLNDGKGNIFEATEGQIIDGRYRVVSIGLESLMIEYVDGRGRQTLRMR